MTIKQENSQNRILDAHQTSSALHDEGLDNIARLLARRAAERDYANHLRRDAERLESERKKIE